MRAITLPATAANPMGLTETVLLLPAHWAGYFERGDASALNAKEEIIVTMVEHLFGVCVGCFTAGARYALQHDASANDIPPTFCAQFTFHNTPDEGESV